MTCFCINGRIPIRSGEPMEVYHHPDGTREVRRTKRCPYADLCALNKETPNAN